MAPLIEWSTVGQIFIESLAAGVLIVGAFALGAKLVAANTGAEPGADTGNGTPQHRFAGLALAGVCFLVAAVAVAYGVYFTIDK